MQKPSCAVGGRRCSRSATTRTRRIIALRRSGRYRPHRGV